MPLDELDVSTVAMDAGGGPGPLSCLWMRWNPALGFGYQVPGVPSAHERTTSNGSHSVFIMLVQESKSDLGLGRTWKIKIAILESSVG